MTSAKPEPGPVASPQTDPSDHVARRLAQHRRACELPDNGFQGWRNRADWGGQPIDVSILITCFDYERFVVPALMSAFEAARAPLRVEVILVDDSSSDGSLSRALSLLARAPVRMCVLKTRWNVGVSRARNLGLSQCSGEFVFVLDVDNTIEPEALLNLHGCAVAQQADAAYGPVQRVNEEGRPLSRVSDRPFDPRILLLQGNYIDAMALFRRRSLLSIGGYDVGLLRVIAGWEDYAVWLEFARRDYRVSFHPEQVGRYLVKPGSMLGNVTDSEMEQARTVFLRRYRGVLVGRSRRVPKTPSSGSTPTV